MFYLYAKRFFRFPRTNQNKKNYIVKKSAHLSMYVKKRSNLCRITCTNFCSSQYDSSIKRVVMVKSRDKRVTEIDYQLKYAMFSTACSIVYKYCTRPISKHLYSGIFKDILVWNKKTFKKDWIYKYVMFHV